jgi:hypothetical protein
MDAVLALAAAPGAVGTSARGGGVAGDAVAWLHDGATVEVWDRRAVAEPLLLRAHVGAWVKEDADLAGAGLAVEVGAIRPIYFFSCARRELTPRAVGADRGCHRAAR